MRGFSRRIALALLLLLPLAAAAQDRAGEPVETRHRLDTASGALDYTARVGWLELRDRGDVRARVFYFAYSAAPADPRRPIAFVFNGGPGASSIYLHMGGLGPKRIAIADNAEFKTEPGAALANPLSWLAFTDLVFVDPVGTGYSRALGSEGRPANPAEFWGVQEDVRWNAEFVARYLDGTGRGRSPVMLVGESYGGFRVALMAEALPRTHQIRPAGVMMISPLIEYGLWLNNWSFDPARYFFLLPSYAAAAWQHGKAGGADRSEAARRRFIAAAEAFALDEYLPALARGAQMSDERRAALYDKLAQFTGLPRALIAEQSGRIDREIFIRNLLGEPDRVLGRYDASMTGSARQPDPSLGGLSRHFYTALDLYVRDELKFLPDTGYAVMNMLVNRSWNLGRGRGGWAPLPGAAEALRLALARNPSLKIMVVHGELDLITPYFASRYALNQIPLPPAQRAGVTFRVYGGGHMMYLHRSEMERLQRDAAAFFDHAVVREPSLQQP